MVRAMLIYPKHQMVSIFPCNIKVNKMNNGSPGMFILAMWRKLSPWPGGSFLFSFLLSYTVPYSGTLGARIIKLQPGSSHIRLKDRRKVRNHLRSIHAVAITNFGELASGLALLTGLPTNVRGIVIKITTEYIVKARGDLHATCHCQPPEVKTDLDYQVKATIKDENNQDVAIVTVIWRLSPYR